MKLKEKIAEDFKVAFKAKDLTKKSVLSVIQSEIKNAEIEKGKREEGLDDENVIAVIQRAIKQRNDSAQQFAAGGRPELAEKELAEVEILKEYLPEQLSDQEIEAEISRIIEETEAQGANDLGKVMGQAMGKLKGKADGNKVREIAPKNAFCLKMQIEINNKNSEEISRDFLVEKTREIIASLKEKNFFVYRDLDLSLALVSQTEMAELNKKYRNRIGPTDVLSFKYGDEEGELEGEIILCYDVIKKNAETDRTAPQRELVLNIIHGILHILNFEHGEKMFSLQKQILAEIS